jgi:hypothetical protein
VTEIQKFLQRIYEILERWMKIVNQDEGDIMSALIIDQLFKTILIKLDSVFGIQDEIMNRTTVDCDEKIEAMKAGCK